MVYGHRTTKYQLSSHRYDSTWGNPHREIEDRTQVCCSLGEHLTTRPMRQFYLERHQDSNFTPAVRFLGIDSSWGKTQREIEDRTRVYYSWGTHLTTRPMRQFYLERHQDSNFTPAVQLLGIDSTWGNPQREIEDRTWVCYCWGGHLTTRPMRQFCLERHQDSNFTPELQILRVDWQPVKDDVTPLMAKEWA